MDILSTIQKRYASFSDKEKQIADYILSNSGQIENINITILAGKVGVSNGTISKFCKKIDCINFANLKILLSGIKATHQEEETSIKQVYQFYLRVVEHTNSMIDQTTIDYVVKQIEMAGHIYVYGIGNSGLTANELAFRLIRMGFPVQSITESHLMLMSSSILASNNLVIAFSVSGESNDIVTATTLARQNGCQVIAFTSFEQSHLARNANFCITVPNTALIDKDHFFNNQFPFIYTIDLITKTFFHNESYKKKMQITINTIMDITH